QFVKESIKLCGESDALEGRMYQRVPEAAPIWLPNAVAYGIVVGQGFHRTPRLPKGALHGLSGSLDTIASGHLGVDLTHGWIGIEESIGGVKKNGIVFAHAFPLL